MILALILAEWPAVVAWGTVAWAPSGSLGRLAAFPLLWLAAEHARSFVYEGFPWNLTGQALYRHPIWLQTAVALGRLRRGSTRRRRLGALWPPGSRRAGCAPWRWPPSSCSPAGAFGAARLASPSAAGPERLGRAAAAQPDRGDAGHGAGAARILRRVLLGAGAGSGRAEAGPDRVPGVGLSDLLEPERDASGGT